MISTTRGIKISMDQFNIELQDLYRHQSHVSDMLRDLIWKTLDDRRTITRLALLYKSVHNIVAISIDEHYANYEKRNITTRKTSSVSITHPTASKNSYWYSFMPKTMVVWMLLSATI